MDISKAINLGMPTAGLPITNTIYVSELGDNSDGSSWEKAYNNVPTALDAALTGESYLNLILVGPKDTPYDFDEGGDPTWSANIEIIGPHRKWVAFTNTNYNATSILKLTGKVSIKNIAFSQSPVNDKIGILSLNGLIITNSSFRIRNCGFNSIDCISAITAITLDGSAEPLTGGIIENIKIVGNNSYTNAIDSENITECDFYSNHIHNCLSGYNIDGTGTTNNIWKTVDVGACVSGFTIKNGDSHHFNSIYLHNNIININDQSTNNDSYWSDINGAFDIIVEPDDLVGISVVSGADDWGTPVLVRTAAAATKPFKMIGYTLSPSVEETMIIRFSTSSGATATYFTQSVFATKKDKASGNGPSTDFIFNVGTPIYASLHGSAITRTVDVWPNIQEI